MTAIAMLTDLIVVWARDAQGDVGAHVVEKATLGFETRAITGRIAKPASWQGETIEVTDRGRPVALLCGLGPPLPPTPGAPPPSAVLVADRADER